MFERLEQLGRYEVKTPSVWILAIHDELRRMDCSPVVLVSDAFYNQPDDDDDLSCTYSTTWQFIAPDGTEVGLIRHVTHLFACEKGFTEYAPKDVYPAADEGRAR